MAIRSKKDLEMALARLKGFKEPSWELEQYATPASIAADWLWQGALKGDLRGKVIADLGCGTGILGIGALLMGARKVFFVDKSQEGMGICQGNYKMIKEEYEIGEGVFVLGDIRLFDGERGREGEGSGEGGVEVVVENPPFGTKEKHADKVFLEKAFGMVGGKKEGKAGKGGKVVWSMHKLATKGFVEAVCRDHGFKITDFYEYEFPIKAVFKWHEKPVQRVEVGLWRMEKIVGEKAGGEERVPEVIKE